MDGIISWVTQNWDNIIAVYLAIVGLASVIVKLTPGLADDTILQKIIAFVGKYLALNVSRADKISVPPVERPK